MVYYLHLLHCCLYETGHISHVRDLLPHFWGREILNAVRTEKEFSLNTEPVHRWHQTFLLDGRVPRPLQRSHCPVLLIKLHMWKGRRPGFRKMPEPVLFQHMKWHEWWLGGQVLPSSSLPSSPALALHPKGLLCVWDFGRDTKKGGEWREKETAI